MVKGRAVLVWGLGAWLVCWGASAGALGDENPRKADRKSKRPTSPAREMAKLRRLHEKLPRELDLDEEQAEIVDEIFEEYFDAMKQDMEAQREARRSNASEVRELIQQLRAARQSGDDDLVSELRGQIAEMRTGNQDAEINHDKLFEEIRAELDEDQLQKFEAMIKRLDQPAPAASRYQGIQRIRRAAEGLDLTPEQQRDTREIFVQMQRDIREAGADPQATQEVEDAAIESILDILDDDQAEEFENKLEALQVQENRAQQLRRPISNTDSPQDGDEVDDSEENQDQD